MPSTYAHYRMGQEVVNLVPEQIKKIIHENKQLFDIGLHGPDILFYYHPLAINEVNEIGYGMHKRPGKYFFEYAAQVICENKMDTRFLAYAFGFICHFALDVTCHGYIDEKIVESGVSHAEIEVEFDRSLMISDGLEPITQKLTNHIILSENNCEVISKFFQNTNSKEVQTALRGMVKYNNLLIAPLKIKRQFVYALLRLSGNYKEMHGLMVNFKENPACKDSTNILRQLYDIARERAVKLICEYDKYLLDEQNLNEIYHFTFGGKEIGNEEQKNEIQNDKNREELGAI